MVRYSTETTIDADLIEQISKVAAACFHRPLDADFASRVQEKPQLAAELAWQDGELVGFKLGYRRHRGTFFAWLGGVRADFRYQGLGRTLMERQHEWCAKNGFSYITTEVGKRWRGMLVLNLKQGFDVVGTHLYDDVGLVVVLSKRLDGTSGPGGSIPPRSIR